MELIQCHAATSKHSYEATALHGSCRSLHSAVLGCSLRCAGAVRARAFDSLQPGRWLSRPC